jgi:hypothetical protein
VIYYLNAKIDGGGRPRHQLLELTKLKNEHLNEHLLEAGSRE